MAKTLRAVPDGCLSGREATENRTAHARFRAKLAQNVALAKVGDISALRAFEISPSSSSPKSRARDPDHCKIAITAGIQVAARGSPGVTPF